MPGHAKWRRARHARPPELRLSIRRLEERRVLDVSAAFLTATGELQVDITGASEVATIASDGGNLLITDATGNQTGIAVDGGGQGTVGVNSLRSVIVRGDAGTNQGVVWATPLTLAKGLRVESTIESATFSSPIHGVTSHGIILDAATIRLGADLETSGLDISLGGQVLLTNDVTLTGRHIVFDQTVNDDGVDATGSDLTVNADGTTRFGNVVGGLAPLEGIETDAAGHTELNADLTASGSTLVFNDPVLLTSSITLTDSGLTGIRFNNTIDSVADAHHNLELTADNGSIVFDGDIGNGSPGDQRLGSLLVHSAAGGVIFGDTRGVEVIRTTGEVNLGTLLAGIGGEGILFQLSPTGLTTLTTDGGDVRFNSRTTLAVDLAVFTNGGTLTFTGNAPLNSQFGTTHRLLAHAGAGAVTFNEDIGTRARLSELEITRADAGVTFGGADSEDPGVADTGPVDFIFTTGAIEIGAGGNAIGGSGVVFNAGTGNTLLISTDGGDVRVNGPTELQSHLAIDTSTGGGDVAFTASAPLDSQPGEANDLTLTLGAGDGTFGATLGARQALALLEIVSASDVRFEEAIQVGSLRQLSGAGETRFEAPVTVTSGIMVELITDSVTIEDRFETLSDGPLLIDVTNDVTINGPISTGAGFVQVLADDDIFFGGSGSITTSAEVLLRADADSVDDAGSGGAVLMTDGALVNAGGATISVFADEDIRLGRLVTTTLVSLDSTSGGIIDGGDLGGADIEASELALHAATGIGTDNAIDTAVSTLAARNESAGGVRIENDLGGDALTIGVVGMWSGVSTGPLASPANLGGDIEITNAGPLEIEAPVLNHAGGHQTLRTVSLGDLTVNRPVQNRGGDGWIMFFSAGDLVIHHSLPEPLAEISVENEGAVRGQADGLVSMDDGDADYVIIRTHSERFPDPSSQPTLSPKFQDPTRFPPPSDTAFYEELEAELRLIRDAVSPQATNFPPIFAIASIDQGGSDIDERGRAILQITLGDDVHLERNWHVTVDWGDGTIENYTVPGNPEASRNFLTAAGSPTNQYPDGTITARFDSGVNGVEGVYYLHHMYGAPPDPDDPAAPIPVLAELRYDPRSSGDTALDALFPDSGSTIFNGIRFFQNGAEEIFAESDDVMTNPGQGVFAFIKIVESTIVPVEARAAVTYVATATSPTVAATTGQVQDFVAASFDEEVFEQYRLFMRVVDDVTGLEQEEEYELPLSVLDDPLALFRERTFPNGHYRIHLEELRTGRVRLIIEVHIYEGRVVPPNFREGAGERQPGAEQTPPTTEATPPQNEEQPRQSPGETNSSSVEASENSDASMSSAGLAGPMASAAAWRARRRRALRSLSGPLTRASLSLKSRRTSHW